MSIFKKYIDKLHLKQWSIGFAKMDLKEVIRKKLTHLPVEWVTPNNKMLSYADPFIFEDKAGNLQVLLESVSTISLDGKITLMTIDRNTLKPVFEKDLLQTDSHFSYPFIFRENGKIYVFPENAFEGKLCCYEYDEENRTFGNKRVVVDQPLVDSTIIKHEGRYWLFSTKIGEARNSELFIFHADSLLGPYTPHVKNPVKSDLRSSRPAGDFIHVDGSLYRPSQYCTSYYGEAITINKITRLDITQFEEEEYFTIRVNSSDAFSYGIHTINAVGNFIVVDGQKSYFEPVQQLTRKLKSFLSKK